MLTRDRARNRAARRLSGLGQVEAESLIEKVPAGAGEVVPAKQFSETVLQEFFKNPDFRELWDLSEEFRQSATALENTLKIIQEQRDTGVISAGTYHSQQGAARDLVSQYRAKAGEITGFLTRAHAETRTKTGEILTEKGYSVSPGLYATSGLGAVIVITILALVKIALIGAAVVAGTLGAAALVRAFRGDRVALVKAQTELNNSILAQTPDADKGAVSRTLAGKAPGDDSTFLMVAGVGLALGAAYLIFR